MKKITLADRVAAFSKIKLGKVAVKVPKLNLKAKPQHHGSKNEIPASSIVSILIKNAVETAKKEKKINPSVAEDKSYKIVKDDKPEINGGYGSVSKSYGMSPRSSYADYGKLFSHIGSFRAKQPYESSADHLDALNKAGESSSFQLISAEAMDKVGKYIKYFRPADPRFDFHTAANSLVPMFGMNSGEWEQVKLWMKLDPVMYALKMKTS